MAAHNDSPERIKTFKEFWPFYLSQHRRLKTKWIHFLGTSIAILLFILAIATQNWWLLLLMFFSGYAFAWYAHFFEELNRPATFKYPVWSLAADFKMWFYLLTGKIKD
jgi:hypothetical protein